MNRLNKAYDLEERTAKFGEDVIGFCRSLSQDVVSRPLISQIVRSATSIGANYMEANGAGSKKDFANKIHLSKKEAKETLHWLRMIGHCFPAKKEEIRKLWEECHELVLIFSKVSSTLKNK